MATTTSFSFSSFQYARREFVTRLARLSMASCFCYTTLALTLQLNIINPEKQKKKLFLLFVVVVQTLFPVPTPSKMMMMMALYYRALYIYTLREITAVSSYWFFFLAAAKFLKHNRQISKPRTEIFLGTYVLCQQDDRFRVWASNNKISGAYYIVNCVDWARTFYFVFFKYGANFFGILRNAHLPQLT